MKIAQRGLILVAVPLVFELIFVSALWMLMKSADEESRRADHAKAVMAHTTYLGKLIYESMSYAVSLAYHSKPEMSAMYQQTAREIPIELEKLRSLTKDAPKQVPLFKLIEVESLITLRKMDAINQNVLAGTMEPLLVMPWVEQVRRNSHVVIEASRDLNLEVMRETQGNKSSIETRAYLQPVLIGGIVVNIVLSVLLAVFFSKSITMRLAVLAENSKRLAAGQPLNRRLYGEDEISKLDHAFHKMASALTEAVRKERAVVEKARDVICSLDADGRFLAVNPAAKESWLYEPDYLIGRRVAEVIWADDRAEVGKAFSAAMSGDSAAAIETRVQKADGELLDVLWSMNWSETEKTLFCVVLDNSQRKEVERLKQTFANMVAHDLRSPLTSILGTLHVLQENQENPLDKDALAKVQRMERVAERLLKLVNDLLEVQSLGRGKEKLRLRETSTGFLIEQAMAAVEALAQGRQIKIKEEMEIFDLTADGDRIVQVLVNLLSNAIRFSPESEQINLKVTKQDDSAYFSVEDRGPGIAPEYQSEIFEPFKQVKDSRLPQKSNEKHKKSEEGTGLGLAISKAIVEAHGGEMGVVSEAGNGALFWFTIPAAG